MAFIEIILCPAKAMQRFKPKHTPFSFSKLWVRQNPFNSPVPTHILRFALVIESYKNRRNLFKGLGRFSHPGC